MNRIMKYGAAVAVLAIAIGVGAGVYAMTGGDDSPAQGDRTGVEDAGGGAAAGACPQENPDCIDTDFDNDGDIDKDDAAGGVAGMCAPDHPDCVDTVVDANGGAGEDDGGATVAPVCAPGYPDCEDMIVNPDGDQARCMEGYPDCEDVVAPGDDVLDPDCVVSSDGEVACPDEPVTDTAGSSDPAAPGAAR